MSNFPILYWNTYASHCVPRSPTLAPHFRGLTAFFNHKVNIVPQTSLGMGAVSGHVLDRKLALAAVGGPWLQL